MITSANNCGVFTYSLTTILDSWGSSSEKRQRVGRVRRRRISWVLKRTDGVSPHWDPSGASSCRYRPSSCF